MAKRKKEFAGYYYVRGKKTQYFVKFTRKYAVQHYKVVDKKFIRIDKEEAIQGIQRVKADVKARYISKQIIPKERKLEGRMVFIRPYISVPDYDLNYEGEPIPVDINQFLRLNAEEKHRLAVFEMHKWFRSHGSNLSNKLDRFVDYEEEAYV